MGAAKPFGFSRKKFPEPSLVEGQRFDTPWRPCEQVGFREKQAFSVRLEVAKNFPPSQVLLKVRSVTALGEPVIGRWGIMGEARNGLHNKFWIKKLCKLVKIGKSAPDLRPGADE